MLTRRGWGAVGTAVAMWASSRVVGAADLHLVAVGILGLVGLAAATVRWKRDQVDATRRMSARRVFAGSTVEVDVEVENRGTTRTAVTLLEDAVPSVVGRPARAVLGSLRPAERRTVTYRVTCQKRGRYRIGPASLSFTDPFGLARRRVTLEEQHQLIVYPAIEDLRITIPAAHGGGAGETTARRLFRAGAEFYAIRPYETGDDLRRIHWRSTARTGDLMIRQDESARRAAATVFLDTRRTAYDGDMDDFERVVSAAASMGSLCLRGGMTLRLSTPELSPRQMTAEAFLESLALVSWSRKGSAVPSLLRLRDHTAGGSTLLILAPPPDDEGLSALIAAGAGYGRRILVVTDPDNRAEQVRRSLTPAGWEVVPLGPGRTLQESWGVRGGSSPGAPSRAVGTASGPPG